MEEQEQIKSLEKEIEKLNKEIVELKASKENYSNWWNNEKEKAERLSRLLQSLKLLLNNIEF